MTSCRTESKRKFAISNFIRSMTSKMRRKVSTTSSMSFNLLTSSSRIGAQVLANHWIMNVEYALNSRIPCSACCLMTFSSNKSCIRINAFLFFSGIMWVKFYGKIGWALDRNQFIEQFKRLCLHLFDITQQCNRMIVFRWIRIQFFSQNIPKCIVHY